MRKSLQTRLTIYFIALVLIPLLIVGAVGTWQTYSAEVPHALEAQAEIAKRVAEQVSNFVKSRESELRSLADINDFSNATREQQTVLLSNLFSNQTVYEELILTNGQGKELILLSRLKVITPKEFGDRVGSDEFEKTKETEKTYFSPVSFNEATGEPFMVVSIPILDLRNGKLDYVVIAKFRFKSVWDFMAQAGASGSSIYMIDSNGFVVAHVNPSFVLKRAQITLPEKNSFTTGLSGDSVALAFEPLSFGGQTFYILAEQPASEALALASRNIVLTIIITLIAIILAGFLGVFAARQITSPIAKLAATAQLISEGDLTQTTSVSNEDEIGALAAAFNRMTAQLRGLIDSLEQRVADRTKALTASAEVSRHLASILDPQQLANAVVNQIQTAFNYYYAQIYLFDQAGENLALAAGTGEAGAEMMKRKHSLPRGRGLVGRAAETKESILVSDTSQDSGWLPNKLLPETKTEAVVPIIIAGKVLGVLDIQDNITNNILPEDITLLESLASQVAIALQNADLYRRAETALQETKILVDYAAEGILVLDMTSGLFTDPNENAAKIFGLSREELVKVGPAQMSPPKQPDGRDSAEKAREQIGIALEKGSNIFEWNHINGQGNEFSCEIRLVRIPGDRPRLRVTVTDITERKRQQELAIMRARQQETINLITQKIQAAATIEDAMQVAARELGRALGNKPTLVALEPDALSEAQKETNEK
ncbi:MAG: GAF domain-containing protein [Anaerolineaceae bacterium]|jgi:PAS domain S-box-containing protein|nr:GAF domain-containing protein [Anaerolineaceae bacterium]OQY89205.1 MAG: hypothetical protein B6D38_07590 [Anaerolineae bacterium UTCFX1]